MTKAEIIETIARKRMVEVMAQNIAHQALNADLSDLCQMVYLILLEYDEEKLQDLWNHNQMTFFIARILVNQFRSSNSPFHTTYRKFRLMVDEDLSLSMGDCCHREDIDNFLTERVLINED